MMLEEISEGVSYGRQLRIHGAFQKATTLFSNTCRGCSEV